MRYPPTRSRIDRELYLPKSWTGDRERCEEAGVPEEVEFATKPVLAQAMLARALDAGVPLVAHDVALLLRRGWPRNSRSCRRSVPTVAAKVWTASSRSR